MENRALAGEKIQEPGKTESRERVPLGVPVSAPQNARARIETKNSNQRLGNPIKPNKRIPEWRKSKEAWASLARGIVWKIEDQGSHPFSKAELAAVGQVSGALIRRMPPELHTWIYHCGQAWGAHWRNKERPADWRAGASLAGWMQREHEEGKFAV